METKKVIIFDVETTGVDKSKDRIIEFCAVVMDWDRLKTAPSTITKSELEKMADFTLSRRFLPDDKTPVSLGARLTNGCSNETLSGCPGFGDFAKECKELFDSVDVVITYNGMVFDIPFVTNELKRYGYSVDWKSKTFYDCFITEKERNPLTLEGTFKRYTGKSMEESGMAAHSALDDSFATAKIFAAQNAESIQDNVRFITDDGFLVISHWQDRNCICINMGKYHGIPLIEVAKNDPSYLDWILRSDFSMSTKAIVELAKTKAAA